MSHGRTDELRGICDMLGIRYTVGLQSEDGRRTDEDRVTTIWAREDDASSSTAFEEDEDGALWCADALSPVQAVSAAVGGWPTATKVDVFNHDTDCATGHTECSACHGSVDPFDRFCRHCGSGFENKEG